MHSFDNKVANQFELINKLREVEAPGEAINIIQQLVTSADSNAIDALLQTLHHHHPAIAATAVEGLVQLGTDAVAPLMNKFKTCRDHGIQAFIVQALAQIGDAQALFLLLEMVGVDVANHCQGNVRRVAARGLGKIGQTARDDTVIQHCVEKLIWALCNAEDWGLRYAAIVSLEEIANKQAISALEQALANEGELVVQERIKSALESQVCAGNL